ncbi:unnamed protein product [Dovyalis caffra]|uniref:Uncharacterized protein n=1 Tax=Dovyalis caffra TaxID=77055 RepID=A0AAV1R4R5_9ROSI|nr:unnamed protein product [Dovyalis caffra]
MRSPRDGSFRIIIADNMADENGLQGDKTFEQAAATMSHSEIVESEIQTVEKSDNKQDSEKSKEKKEITNVVPYYKLFSFADPIDYLLMFVGTIAAIGNGSCMPTMTIMFGQIVNAFGSTSTNIEEVTHEVSQVALKYVYLGLGAMVAAFLQVSCWMVTGERQAARIRNLYLEAILRQEIGFFDKETSTGEIIGRMSGDTILIQDAMGEKVGKFLQLVTTFTAGFIIAFIKGWKLALVMVSSIPLLVLSGAFMAFIVSKMASRGQTAYSHAANLVDQTIGSIRTVVSFTGEKQVVDQYNKSLTEAVKTGVHEGLAIGVGYGVVALIVFSTYALAVWFGAKMILNEGYSGGDVVNVNFAVLTGSMSLGQSSSCLSAFASGRAAGFKLFEVIDRKSQIDPYKTNGRMQEDIQGDIELKDIHFSYPARLDEQVFNGFSLTIPTGTTTALVGESGSGKSTVIGLIERFYDPQAGEVLIDGINLKEFQLKWIRQKIGLVSQEPVLFACSIKDNIAYGKDVASSEEIRTAAELANAAKFIDKLPQGLDTMVGENGTQLSGGQKQRVAIARAIIKDPRILLLDEATSALDTESERSVQAALDRVMVSRTTVVVAHRLSTVRNADAIAVIHQGKIVEKGSHMELTKDPEGEYSQLIKLQELRTQKDNDVLNDPDGPESLADSGRNSSKRSSFIRSVSRGSSLGHSSRRSFSAAFGVPTGIDLPDTTATEAHILDSESSKSLPEVPLYRLAYLNKPEIPVLLLAAVAAIVAVIQPIKQYLFTVAGCQLIKRIRSMCFEKVIYMEVGWFDEPDHSSGAIGARLSADAAMVKVLVGDALGMLVQNIGTAVVALFIAFQACWQLAFIMLALLPLLGVNGFTQQKFMRGFSADAKIMYEEASQVANDAVRNIRTVASFCSEEKVMELYRKSCEGPMKTGIRLGLVSGMGFGLSFFLLFTVYATSFYSGSRLVSAGHTTFAEVFRVFFALTMASFGISQTSSLAPDLMKAKGAAASVFAILDRNSKIDSSDDSGTIIENFKGEIEFQHVSFKYPTRPDVQILRDLCLAIGSGKTVALVGESGSGKSTVISLLQRFYDPDSGWVTLDGIEIQKLQIKWLRQQMGLVSQEPSLFNDTIRANIAYGKEGNATEAEILAASELANAHKFISSLQQGYDTIVGDRGIQLSGGQKQRVAIARAIVKAPKILLLDEATSALDAESERVVQDALEKVMVNRTTVIVAHRLSTIKNADVIAVVRNGVIAEKGKHETLINIKDGVYASLVSLHTSASSS